MKTIKIAGLALFLLGFGIFLGSFFTASYQLTTKVLDDQIGDKKEVFLSAGQDMVSHVYSSNFSFVRDLDKTFRQVNQQQIQVYGITDDEVDQLANANKGTFELASLEKVFKEGEVADYKKRTFKDYGGWLDGREFANPGELRSQLNNVVDNIKKYQIVNEKGFDKYKIKDLKYSITKEASTGPVSDSPGMFFFLTYIVLYHRCHDVYPAENSRWPTGHQE